MKSIYQALTIATIHHDFSYSTYGTWLSAKEFLRQKFKSSRGWCTMDFELGWPTSMRECAFGSWNQSINSSRLHHSIWSLVSSTHVMRIIVDSLGTFLRQLMNSLKVSASNNQNMSQLSNSFTGIWSILFLNNFDAQHEVHCAVTARVHRSRTSFLSALLTLRSQCCN